MNIIKLSAIGSTNDFLKEKLSEQYLENFTVVVAENQTSGKGQMGSVWEVESGKNLTFSVLVKDLLLDVQSVFHLNVAVAVSVATVFKNNSIPKTAIKWPNDILADNRKIGGILIENILKSDREILSIIGIGLNVNQQNFENLPKAGSLYTVTGKQFDKELLLQQLLEELKRNLTLVQRGFYEEIWQTYDSLLYRKGIPSSFENSEGNRFMGIIQKVNTNGKLEVLLENDEVIEFGIKEVTLLY
ncbi:biotin--[acetyl-CoA-carboxylase] ligase [Flavobacterium sp.]|uniref:biotin--[acetyl-CoA-carboxylase] ligase n=1 Tax=Flavobacterium sp. TaxID=239 RepID=UPI0028BD6DB7|nr:biotin--[acetyl-CoA-carboxylase] ligase [Flavobacterium sp.]